MNNLYRDPVLEALIAKLDADGPRELKGKYVQGDPIAISSNDMPIVFITKDRSVFQPDEQARGQETHFMGITLNIVYNGAEDIYKGSFLQSGTVSVWNLVEGRSDTDMTLKPDTIMHVLRKNTVLNGNNKLYIDVNTNPEVSYGVSSAERRGLWTTEAVISTTLRINQLKPS